MWSIVVGMPLCAVGGVFYSWASGQTVVNGFVNAYGALYKIPGDGPEGCGTTPTNSCWLGHARRPEATVRELCLLCPLAFLYTQV